MHINVIQHLYDIVLMKILNCNKKNILEIVLWKLTGRKPELKTCKNKISLFILKWFGKYRLKSPLRMNFRMIYNLRFIEYGMQTDSFLKVFLQLGLWLIDCTR